MKKLFAFTVPFFLVATSVRSASLPASDQRANVVKDVNTPRVFAEIKSKSDWQARSQAVRENAAVSCGLWPTPERPALNARVFDRVERDGYSLEKVYFQTYPGFYLAGNLYRPLGRGTGPFPAVLNPHGHGKFGRLHDDDQYSNPARCIQFARSGIIAFSYDMVGYNDTMQLGVHRKFFLQPELQLWGISLMGLQTWNSVRALDFLESLPDVDRKKLGCTGESGGGSQTFLLGAVDDRLAVQAPICMVSSTMQGGCQCENAPGLRPDFSSMDLAAAAAPRPQLFVAATGDWTKLTMEVEGPAVASAYRALGETNRFHYVRYDFGHNYNRTTRETVYGWFNRWLLGAKSFAPVSEQAYEKIPDLIARVWPDGKLPDGALNEAQFTASLISAAKAEWTKLLPRDRSSLSEYKRVIGTAWRHNLKLDVSPEILVEQGAPQDHNGYTGTQLAFGRPGKGDRLPAVLFTPKWDARSSLVIVVNPEGKSASMNFLNRPIGLARTLVEEGHQVLVLDLFRTGELSKSATATNRNYFDKFFTSYNRTDIQERVQDLVTACAVARTELGARKVVLCGIGRAGLWVALAAPAADAVVADCDELNADSDAAWLSSDLFAPGLRKMGGFEGTALLAAPNPILIHHTGTKFSSVELHKTYSALKVTTRVRAEPEVLGDAAIVEWLATVVK